MKLKIYDSSIETSFLKNSLSVFLAKADFDGLNLSTEELKSPIYYKIRSDDTLKKFVFFAKLECLNPKSSLPKGYLYVPKELLNKEWICENEMLIEIEKLSLDNLHKADAITIKLNEEEVRLWADGEINSAINNFLLNTKVTYNAQLVWLKPRTKSTVIGEVAHIYPAPQNHLEPILISKEETKVIFEGLSENKQKVIDFNNIGGLSHLIDKLREIIQIPLTYPDLLSKFNIKPPKGMLMYGPPGNGKTMIARAVAQSMGSNFITIDLTDATSKYSGVAEQKLKEKFEQASAKGNCVIFIDEIDSIASKRSDDTPEHQIKIVSSLLSLMDGLGSNAGVFVIGATNRLNAIDPALRRPGRFDLEFEVPLPSPVARLDILAKYIKLDKPNILNNEINIDFLQILSELTTGYSGADISLLYREAVMDTIRQNIEIESETGKINLIAAKESIKLAQDNFLNAIKSIKPTSLRSYENSVVSVNWDNLIAFDKLKTKMEEIHHQISKHYLLENLCGRLGNSNVIFVGSKGSGKRTLITSFSKQYNYEILTIDILDLFSIPLFEASREIENGFIKAKQVSPSIIFIKNIEKVSDNQFYYLKIINELEKLNNRNKIITVMQFESTSNIPADIKGYKGFENIFDFTTLVDYEEIIEFIKLKIKSETIVNNFVIDKKPIGQVLNYTKSI
jgi:SpoVK/Ycf46/Vps4 family AAA+-type ATPase